MTIPINTLPDVLPPPPPARRRVARARYADRVRTLLNKHSGAARDRVLDSLAALETTIAPMAALARQAAPHLPALPPPFADAPTLLDAVHAMRAVVQSIPREGA
ncbi:hypothetical protein [Niveispirillum sp. KHB5.9]|uniref:hypothetical protein n=1 Tax=Niveispirillum sp. KHB5.9 TaxID=3400269 RepID=UPI003A83D78F